MAAQKLPKEFPCGSGSRRFPKNSPLDELGPAQELSQGWLFPSIPEEFPRFGSLQDPEEPPDPFPHSQGWNFPLDPAFPRWEFGIGKLRSLRKTSPESMEKRDLEGFLWKQQLFHGDPWNSNPRQSQILGILSNPGAWIFHFQGFGASFPKNSFENPGISRESDALQNKPGSDPPLSFQVFLFPLEFLRGNGRESPTFPNPSGKNAHPGKSGRDLSPESKGFGTAQIPEKARIGISPWNSRQKKLPRESREENSRGFLGAGNSNFGSNEESRPRDAPGKNSKDFPLREENSQREFPASGGILKL